MRFSELARDPYPVFARLRADAPVVWAADARMWLVLRYADCEAVLRDSGTFTTHSPDSLIMDTFGPQMLSLDGTEHRRHRRPFNAVFAPNEIRHAWTDSVRRRVDTLMANFQTAETVELRASFASPLAISTVAEFLGFSTVEVDALRAWYADFAAALANFDRDADVRARGRASAEHFRNASKPLAGLMMRVASDSELDEQAIFSNALLILFGGIETTESMILNALWALLTHPDQLALVREDESRVFNAIHESLRWDAAVQTCTRHATRDVLLHDSEIKAGDVVQCMIGSANRDPERFANPDLFDVTRPDAAEHLTFGYGRHLCIGKHLALLEAQTAVTALLRAFPRLRLDPARAEPPAGYEFRKPASLWVMLGGQG